MKFLKADCRAILKSDHKNSVEKKSRAKCFVWKPYAFQYWKVLPSEPSFYLLPLWMLCSNRKRDRVTQIRDRDTVTQINEIML